MRCAAITLIASLSACIVEYSPTTITVGDTRPATAIAPPVVVGTAPAWRLPRKAGETVEAELDLRAGPTPFVLGLTADAEPASGAEWQVVATLLTVLGASPDVAAECLQRRLDVAMGGVFDGAPSLGGLHWSDSIGHVVYVLAALGAAVDGPRAVERDRVLEHELAHMVQRCLGLGDGHPSEIFGDGGALVQVFGERHAGRY